RKMSKSYGNAIDLTDSGKEIDSKVSQMITDPQRARKSDPGDPDICNVFTLHEIYSDASDVEGINQSCRKAGIGCVECKKKMAASLKMGLAPIQEKRKVLGENMDRVKDIVAEGNRRARAVAVETMAQVRDAVKI
ncbi:MAG TPA: tryptophan--tRNA ligase, partial [Deltaproteobacteria bacterium]|nr:tryptophan--tRNA ligase [Deltaproteobacteria bacterium]